MNHILLHHLTVLEEYGADLPEEQESGLRYITVGQSKKKKNKFRMKPHTYWTLTFKLI